MSKTSVQVDGEHETPTGWLYTLTICWDETDSGESSDHEITLAWVDHEHLVGGSITPSAVALVAGRLAAEHFGRDGMPERSDVSSLRRLIVGFDKKIKAHSSTR